MNKLKTNACAAFMLALMLSAAGCASTPSLPPMTVSCPVPPAPAAWAMEPASSSLSKLDQLFGISAPE